MNLHHNIIHGIERLFNVFKTLLWEQAKHYRISPLQLQILLFVRRHKEELCQISRLAKEFNVAKATVSDAVKVLHKKGYIERQVSAVDSRRYTIHLTQEGRQLAEKIESFTRPLEEAFAKQGPEWAAQFYDTLVTLVVQLNRQGILQVQRTCYTCRYFTQRDHAASNYCSKLEQLLGPTEIRLDCPEHDSDKSD